VGVLQEEAPLPWVFRAALAVVRFVFTHKIEILLGIFVLFALFWLLAVVITTTRKGT